MADPKHHPGAPEAPVTSVKAQSVTVTSHEYTAPDGGVVEGQAYMIDGHLVVADATVGAGAKFSGRAGVVEYAKVHEQAWKSGDDVYWDAFGGCFSNTVARVDGSGGGNVKVGTADKEASRPSVTGFVRLESAPAP